MIRSLDMSSDAEMAFVHVKMGITFAFNGGIFLIMKLGYVKSLEMLFSGNRYTSRELLESGLVSHVLDSTGPEERLGECIKWIQDKFSQQLNIYNDSAMDLNKCMMNNYLYNKSDLMIRRFVGWRGRRPKLYENR